MSKELDKLIEQILNEKNLPQTVPKKGSKFKNLMRKLDVPSTNLPHSSYNSASNTNKTKLNKIADKIVSQDGREDDISSTDFEQVFKMKNKDDANAVKVASQIARGTKDPDIRKDIQAVMPGKGNVEKASDAMATTQTSLDDADIDSFSYPRPLTNLGNVNHGKFLGSQNALINSVFTKGTFKGRIEELNKLGNDLLDTKEIAKMSPRQLLQKVQVADLFDMLFNQQDQRSGGYYFEAFLALLSGGNVVGGENGAADFKVGGGQSGSSKFYENWSGIKQSTKGWKKGESIHYVVGITEKDRDSTGAAEYMAIKMYYVVATNLGPQNTGNTNFFVLTDGDGNRRASEAVKQGASLYISDISRPDSFYVGEFRIIKGAGDSYKNALSSYTASNSTANSSKALEAMKLFFQSLYKADESTKKYINSKGNTPQDQLKADEAFKQYDAADEYLVSLMNLLKPATKPDYKTRAARNESKTPLDKLIESIIKQKLLK